MFRFRDRLLFIIGGSGEEERGGEERGGEERGGRSGGEELSGGSGGFWLCHDEIYLIYSS